MENVNLCTPTCLLGVLSKDETQKQNICNAETTFVHGMAFIALAGLVGLVVDKLMSPRIKMWGSGDIEGPAQKGLSYAIYRDLRSYLDGAAVFSAALVSTAVAVQALLTATSLLTAAVWVGGIWLGALAVVSINRAIYEVVRQSPRVLFEEVALRW